MGSFRVNLSLHGIPESVQLKIIVVHAIDELEDDGMHLCTTYDQWRLIRAERVGPSARAWLSWPLGASVRRTTLEPRTFLHHLHFFTSPTPRREVYVENAGLLV
jgi:hypothetical protein